MTPEVFSSMFEAGCIGWWTVQDRNTTVFMTSEGGRAFISHYGGIVTDFFEVSSRRNALFIPNMESVRQQWATVPPSRPDIGSFMRAYEAWWKGEFEGKTFSDAMKELKSWDAARVRYVERRHDLTYGDQP